MKNSSKLAPKREDHALLTGQACFTDDVQLNNPLHIAFIRAEIAHGFVQTIDTSAANDAFAIHTHNDVAHLGELSVNPVLPIKNNLDFPILTNEIKALGQPIAAILAASSDAAQDLAGLSDVDVLETERTQRLIAQKSWRSDAPMPQATHTVACSINHPRLAPSPMEPRAIAISYDIDRDGVTIWHSTQTPHRTRSELATILNIKPSKIRVIARHVGGAFGMKASLYPEEIFAVWAAFRHRRDVKWTATRSEEFLSATHGRALSTHGQLGFDDLGNFTSLKAQITAPIGPWLPNSALIPAWNGARILPSGYRIPVLDITTKAMTDGRGPIGIYRGAGRPEANTLIERLIDKAANSIGVDPIEMRRRNLLSANDLPHRTTTQNTLDSGDYRRALDILKAVSNYENLRDLQAHRRAAGELIGIGVGFYVEPSGEGWESARVTLTESGAIVASGSSSQGQARETAYAQIAAQALALKSEQVTVILADTDEVPPGIGALASRSTAIGGSAVAEACAQLRNDPNRRTAEVRYHNSGQAWGYGAYLVVVSICAETGVMKMEQITCVDDVGRIINPDLVQGQILGGIAQGLGEAILEHVEYDEENQLLTGSFMDYAMPRASDMPPVDIHSFETPSPTNLLGAKGVGEAGTIAAPLTILNAAVDALSPLGVTDLQMPLTSENLWQTIQDAKSG